MSRRRGGAPEMPEGDDAVGEGAGAEVAGAARDAGAGAAAGVPSRAGGARESAAVTVDGDLPATLPALREAGLQIESTLTAISVVLGTVDADSRHALEKLAGVHVEMQDLIQLPPPDEPQ